MRSDNVPLWQVLLVFAGIGLFLWWKVSGPGETPVPRAASPSLYSRAQLPTNDEIAPYLDQLAPAVNRVAREDRTCRENLDPISVGINRVRTKHYAEVTFQVRCWKHGEKNTIIYFDIDGRTIAPYMTDPFK